MNYPYPGSYAVAQIDLEATLSGITDQDVIEAAMKIRTTKSLVLLNMIKQPPLPGRSTFCFDAWLIGPGLRPEEPEKGATSDMCIPIFPAIDHPTGRTPFRPEPAFPFSNCYHWSGHDLWLDLRIKNGEFTQEKGEFVFQPSRDAVVMMDLCGDDTAEMEIRVARRARELAGGEECQSEVVSATVPHGEVFVNDGQAAAVVIPEAFPVDDLSSFSYRSMSSGSSYWSDDEDDEDRFTEDDERACQPVVEIWLDLAGQLKEGEIPSPLEFAEQYKELYALLRKNREAEKAKQRAEREQERVQAMEPSTPPLPVSPSRWKTFKSLPLWLFGSFGRLSCTGSRGHHIDL